VGVVAPADDEELRCELEACVTLASADRWLVLADVVRAVVVRAAVAEPRSLASVASAFATAR
jgi:hypothetical protein